MNYLIVEGYADAAVEFAHESGTEPEADLSSIHERMSARQQVQRGDLVGAMERVNDLNPEILDTNAALHFHLQQQRLIELIRQGRTDEAIAFAQSELAPRGERDPALLDELERTMALLVYEMGEGTTTTTTATNGHLQELLDVSRRSRIASELNAAILARQNQDIAHKLPLLLRLMRQAEHDLAERGILCPQMDWETGALIERVPDASAKSKESGDESVA
eukprot:ctg_948.g332